MPSGQRWINVVHVRKNAGGSFSPTDWAAAQPILVRLWRGTAFGSGNDWLSNCNNQLTLDDMTCTPLDGSTPSIVTSVNLNGVSAAVSAPSEVAQVLTLRTALRGRAHRGRIYLPSPVVSTYAAGGVLIGANITNFLTQAVGVQNALIAAGYIIVVASYLGSGSASDVITFTMDNKADVQRGRK
jgi:hypothetical protein